MAVSTAPNDDTASNDEDPSKPAKIATTAASVDAGAEANGADTLRYEPFKTGDQIHAEVAISFSAEVQGGPPELFGSNHDMRVEATLHVDLEILKSSGQTLDELEVTLTPISMHSEFGGQTSNSNHDPRETYDVTLSGQTPSVRTRSGSPLEPEGRAALTVLITPLVEFHNHWVQTPTLILKPGWSSKVPIATPTFMAAPADKVSVGPLAIGYTGRDDSATSVPFDLTLPIEYGTDLGKLDFDLTGKANLDRGKGRPLSLDLSGTLGGTGGPNASHLGLRGTAKFSAKLSY